MTFKEFEKHLKGIKYTANGAWDISLPYESKDVQKLIDICREHLIVDWHITYPEPTEDVPNPTIFFYWDRTDNP